DERNVERLADQKGGKSRAIHEEVAGDVAIFTGANGTDCTLLRERNGRDIIDNVPDADADSHLGEIVREQLRVQVIGVWNLRQIGRHPRRLRGAKRIAKVGLDSDLVSEGLCTPRLRP